MGRRDQAEAVSGVWGRGGSINWFSHDGAERENRDASDHEQHTLMVSALKGTKSCSANISEP